MKNIFISFGLLMCLSCNDQWLDEKRDISLVVPQTLQDLRLILNNSNPLLYECIGLAEISCGDIYFTDTDWQSKIALERFAYIWSDRMFEETTYLAEWDEPYRQVFLANLVLEGVADINPDNSIQAEWDNVKGSALYYRARAFFHLSQQFCKAYDPLTAKTDPGIPLRLTSDINADTKRASIQQTYDQIISDLKKAALLLDETPAYKTDPSKPAAYGLLARCCLIMGNYEEAQLYASQFLELNDQLMDYNLIDGGRNYPFEIFNEEVVFYGSISSNFLGFRAPTGKIDPALYELYDEDDLRKDLFFRLNNDGSHSFRGNYSGSSSLFGGIATDEFYLIRAECYAREGELDKALDDLNALRFHRYQSGTYTPLTTTDPEIALEMILQERRKELLMRGLRWSDLRRLNKDPKYAVTLERTVNDEIFTLIPNDPRYVLPIPQYAIDASGIQQNER